MTYKEVLMRKLHVKYFKMNIEGNHNGVDGNCVIKIIDIMR